MSKNLTADFINSVEKNSQAPTVLSDFKLKTHKKNQLVAFFKPETFLEKSPEQIEKIMTLAFKKLEEYQVQIDGAAVFPGQTLKQHSIMDRHYGVINTLSKNASKILTKEERDLVFSTLGITDPNTQILGGHEAFEVSGSNSTYEFDNYWLSSPSTKIKSGFYVRSMKIADKNTVVVNGFHPHQLEHYTGEARNLGVMLVSSDTAWSTLRTEMLGDTFPQKANPQSIRGLLYKNPKEYGFDSVGIENNVVHLSAGPSEALFEIDNFLRSSLGVDFIKAEAKLAEKLLLAGFGEDQIKKLLTDKQIHEELEHSNTDEALEIIKKKFISIV